MRTVRWADIGVKVLLAALIAVAVVRPDLAGIKEKAATARLIVYPLAAAAVPIWWLALGRLRRLYPWGADLLVTLPWLLDLLGNRLDLFDSVSWWDDAMHLINWGLLTAGILLLAVPGSLSRGLVLVCALAFGSCSALLWELAEYVTFLRGSPELQTAYTDTLGDLLLGTLGALLAGLVIGRLRHRAPAAAVAPTDVAA